MFVKQIIAKRKRENFYWNIVKILLLFLIHYFVFFTYIFIFRLYSIFVNFSFIDLKSGWVYLIAYYIFLGPGINAFMHIHYQKTGSLTSRAFMWINTLILIVSMPAIIFIV